MFRVELVLTPGQTPSEVNEISPGWDKRGVEQCSRGPRKIVLALHFYLKYLMHQVPCWNQLFHRERSKDGSLGFPQGHSSTLRGKA